MWQSQYFLLICITVEEYFIISTTLIFNLYFLFFVVPELSAFIFIVFDFFTLIFHILPESVCIHLISTSKWFILYLRKDCGEWNKYSWQLIKSLKLKEVYLWGRATVPLKCSFKHPTNMDKVFKVVNQFKKVNKNIQRNYDKTPVRKEQFWPILDWPVHWL